MLQSVIMDWSGTLVDDLPAVLEATNHVLRSCGRESFSLSEFRERFRLPVEEFYAEWLPGIAPSILEAKFHERFREVQPLVRPLPHAEAFLQFCERSGVLVYVLTSVPEPYFRAQSEGLNWSRFLRKAWTGVRDKRRTILEVLSEGNCQPGATLLVGDMAHDLDAARSGGVKSCAVLTGYAPLERLRAARPDVLVEHLGELELLLRGGGLGASGSPAGLARSPVATVGGLIRRPDGRFLLVRTRKWANLWGIPGGKIKYGEPSEKALERELLEETGLRVSGIRFVLVQDCIESGEFYRPEHFVLLNYLCETPDGSEVRLNDEAQEYRWLTADEAQGLALNRPTQVLLEAIRRSGLDACST